MHARNMQASFLSVSKSIVLSGPLTPDHGTINTHLSLTKGHFTVVVTKELPCCDCLSACLQIKSIQGILSLNFDLSTLIASTRRSGN